MYMAYRGRLMVDDGTIFRTMQVFKQHGGLVALHAGGDVIDVLIQQVAAGHTAPKYHAKTRPPVAEAEAVFRAICIAEIAECPVYFVHMSSRQAVEQLQRARDRACQCLPKPVRIICCSMSRCTISQASRAANTS